MHAGFRDRANRIQRNIAGRFQFGPDNPVAGICRDRFTQLIEGEVIQQDASCPCIQCFEQAGMIFDFHFNQNIGGSVTGADQAVPSVASGKRPSAPQRSRGNVASATSA